MQRKLLTNGNIFKRTDGRWNGVVWYSDEQGEKKRKSFCGTTKQEVKEKITEFLADFDRQLTASDESRARLEESMGRWLRVFKFPSVERGTYDRLEGTAKYAAEHGFSAFTTSLLASTYQNHEAIAEAAERYAKQYGVTFLYRDFRPNFRAGNQRARELGFYMQKYCGCVFSEADRYQKQIDRDKAKFAE